MSENITEFEKELKEAGAQFDKLQQNHVKFVPMNAETHKLEAECLGAIGKQKKAWGSLKSDLKVLGPTMDATKRDEYAALVPSRLESLKEFEKQYPSKLSPLLYSLLGSVNVTIPVISDRLKYKTEYEDFKLSKTSQIIAFSALCLVFPIRELDMLFQLLLVWFYSVMTIREHILIANGSRIMAWWLVHHYLSILLALLFLTWSSDVIYESFQNQFMVFSIVLGVAQLIQHKYQAEVLYKKRALGLTDAMDTTGEIPTPSIFVWVLAFTFIVFQFYNAFSLVKMVLETNPADYHWQALAVAAIFATHGIGNSISLYQVVSRKFARKVSQTKSRVSHAKPKTT